MRKNIFNAIIILLFFQALNAFGGDGSFGIRYSGIIPISAKSKKLEPLNGIGIFSRKKDGNKVSGLGLDYYFGSAVVEGTGGFDVDVDDNLLSIIVETGTSISENLYVIGGFGIASERTKGSIDSPVGRIEIDDIAYGFPVKGGLLLSLSHFDLEGSVVYYIGSGNTQFAGLINVGFRF